MIWSPAFEQKYLGGQILEVWTLLKNGVLNNSFVLIGIKTTEI